MSRTPRPFPLSARKWVPIESFVAGPVGPVTLEQREGVFIHSFRHRKCGLKFLVYSWQATRHDAQNVCCPECGERGAMEHYRVTANESREFSLAPGAAEIFWLTQWPLSRPMDDSAMRLDPRALGRVPAGPVALADREGVFAHSWQCMVCKLEFVTLSWQANRHRVGVIWCPECGKRRPMTHYRAVLSESRTITLDLHIEIDRLWPWPHSEWVMGSATRP